MSLAKRIAELPKNSKLRKQGEVFLSGKPVETKKKKKQLKNK